MSSWVHGVRGIASGFCFMVEKSMRVALRDKWFAADGLRRMMDSCLSVDGFLLVWRI